MKKSVTFRILALVFVCIIVVALVAYNYLAADYVPVNTGNQNNSTTAQQQNKTATNFTVLDTNGNQVTLESYFGKPIIVNFWATWCGPCKNEMAAFDAVYQEYGDDITFLMVNLTDGQRDTVDSVDKFVATNGYTFPVYYDTTYSAATAYNVMSIPTTIFINEKGEIVNSHIGAMNQATLQTYVDTLLAE